MRVLAILSFCLASIFATPVSFAVDNFSEAQVKQIQQIIHDYVVNNPQVLMEAGKKLHEQEINQRKQQIMSTLPKAAKQLFADNLPGRGIVGNHKGTSVLVEFLSYQCGHCKSTAQVVDEMIKKHPELKVIYIEWPIFGNDAVYASKAALAAGKQNKFKEAHQAFLAADEQLNKAAVDKIIKKLNLNMKQWQKDMKDSALDSDLKENFNLAQNLGLMGTPSFIFANSILTKFSLVPGQTPEFPADMEKALQEVK